MISRGLCRTSFVSHRIRVQMFLACVRVPKIGSFGCEFRPSTRENSGFEALCRQLRSYNPVNILEPRSYFESLTIKLPIQKSSVKTVPRRAAQDHTCEKCQAIASCREQTLHQLIRIDYQHICFWAQDQPFIVHGNAAAVAYIVVQTVVPQAQPQRQEGR